MSSNCPNCDEKKCICTINCERLLKECSELRELVREVFDMNNKDLNWNDWFARAKKFTEEGK